MSATGPAAQRPNFTLSKEQEDLLFQALQSNSMPPINTSFPDTPDLSMPLSAFTDSPRAPGLGPSGAFEDSPFIDYDYEFDADGSYDYDLANDSQGQMIGKLPGPSSSDGDNENHDKRSHPDDDGDDEESGGGKRREGEDKTAKKPGRKPLTSEPTSKRKAQNRAAQRAFRERKEKHLKDLETKVEDLQKASESANHENSILRAQVEKMSAELREYKRTVLGGNAGRGTNSAYMGGRGLGNVSNPNEVNFQFEFPRFGRLPGPPITNGNAFLNGVPKSASSAATHSSSDSTTSPHTQSMQHQINGSSNGALTQTPTSVDSGDMANLSGLFDPAALGSIGSPFNYFGNESSTNSSNINPSRSNSDSNGLSSTGNNTSYSSPSDTSNTGNGANSSCGTSPEPTAHHSPTSGKPESALTTIGEEQSGNLPAGEMSFCERLNMACGTSNSPIPRTMSETQGANAGTYDAIPFDMNGIDWFAQQNNNQFDPQLFGDYREPQDNILSNDPWTDQTFFNEALATDFTSPFNTAPSPAVPAPAKDLTSPSDAVQEDEEVVPGEDVSKLMNCNTIWDRISKCPTVAEHGFDLDLLCSDLQKKAKCSETGAVIHETDFKKVIANYVKDGGQGQNQMK